MSDRKTIHFSSVARAWPRSVPLLALAGSGERQLVALSGTEIRAEDALNRELAGGHADDLVAVLSYDDCVRMHASLERTAPPLVAAGDAARSRYFRVSRWLEIEPAQGSWRVIEAGDRRARADALPSRESPGSTSARAPSSALSWCVDEREVLASCAGSAATACDLPVSSSEVRASRVRAAREQSIPLIPQESDDAYLERAASAIRDVHAGRFYQINLLRYFSLAVEPPRSWLVDRLDALGGDFSAWIELPDLHLVSFSPERFLRHEDDVLATEPVKGTAARDLDDPGRDLAIGERLRASEKDLAELHMIVDLMRNDLHRVSEPGTVRVTDATRLDTHATVHHLSARIESRPRTGSTLRELLAALCPGGSITGAPKRAAIEAIRAYEGKARGYFMGHVLRHEAGGRLDSSILIRTLVKRGGEPWAYAAGSGLVAASDPRVELAEIDAKCAVVGPRLEGGGKASD